MPSYIQYECQRCKQDKKNNNNHKCLYFDYCVRVKKSVFRKIILIQQVKQEGRRIF